MSRYSDLPTFDLSLLEPRTISPPEMKGGGFNGPRNGNGQSVAVEYSAGGSWVWAYESLIVNTQEEHEYLEGVVARMAGSFRFMNVPIMSEWLLPLPMEGDVQQLSYSRLFEPDGSMIDGATGDLPAITGAIVEAAALNAGRVRIAVTGLTRPLRHTVWFSINHPNKGWRAYKAWEVSNQGSSYVLGITPPLREAVPAGTPVELVNPLVVARFPVGFTAPRKVGGFWQMDVSLQFEEAV